MNENPVFTHCINSTLYLSGYGSKLVEVFVPEDIENNVHVNYIYFFTVIYKVR